MKVDETVKLLESGAARTLMAQLYGEDGVEANVKRYDDLLAGYEKMFGGEGDVKLFSSPGRTEISGNHTDHNHGKVLALSLIHIYQSTGNQRAALILRWRKGIRLRWEPPSPYI